MILMSIDGACRRNGKPDCVSSGGVVVQHLEDNSSISIMATLGCHEHNSTNQRGELNALLKALMYLTRFQEDAIIVTDSEYLFNAMTKGWPTRWKNEGWLTAAGEPVKNADLWASIDSAASQCHEVQFYHIKGHVIPFGKVTAGDLLNREPNGYALYRAVAKRFDELLPTKADAIEHAQQLSERNNGFRLNDQTLKNFVVLNVVADAVATDIVEKADRKI